MSLAAQIKPISYLKSNAEDIVENLETNSEAIRQQETFALLKLLNLGRQELQAGKFQPVDDFFKAMDAED